MARILIIDDNEQLRAFCREVLEAEGHVVDDAPDGDVGVQMFNEHPSDMVLCDIFMPNKDGIETIQELTAQYFGVKIIAISGGSRHLPDFLPFARRLGAMSALAKPFGYTDLLDAIHGALAEL